MNTLDRQQAKQKIDKTDIESKKFDARLGMALSNGVILDNELGSNDLHQVDAKAGVLVNQEYFQDRISRELSMLKRSPKNPKLLNRVGDIYFANLKFDKAKSYFKRAFRENTDSIVTANKLAESYMVLGRVDQADKVLDLVKVKKDNNTLHTHAVIKMILNLLDESEDLIDLIAPDSSNYYEAINTLGLVKLLKEDYSEAEKCFKRSIENKNEYVPAQNNLAIAYQNQNKIDKAVEQYRKAFTIDPNYLTSYNNLYNLLVKNDRIEEAYDVMVSALHLSDQANDIQFRIGWAQMRLGNFKTAINEYEKVLKLLPENSNTLNNIGYCYILLNNAPKALDALRRSLKNDHNNVVPMKNLMELYEALGRPSDSRKLAKRLIQLVPNEPNAMTFIADEYAKNEDWAQAIRLYEHAYLAKPRWMSLYISLTQIYADVFPDLEKGVEAARFAIDNKLNNYEKIYNNLVHLYLVNDKLDEAEEWLSKLTDDNSISLATLGLYHLKNGDISKARKFYSKAKDISNGGSKLLIEQRESFDLGNFYLSKGKDEKALKAFNSVLKLKDSGYKYIYALALEKVKDLKEKIEN
ncbi:MAG: tetratricopeptide repeat protein [Candidatus Saccharimonadales bacterium]